LIIKGAQELVYVGLGEGIKPTIGQDNSKSKRCPDIWKNINCMKLFTGGNLNFTNYDVVEKERAKRKVMEYYWQDGMLMFLNLVVPKLKDGEKIVNWSL